MQTQWFEPGWDPEDDDQDEEKDWGDWYEFESSLNAMGRHPSSPSR